MREVHFGKARASLMEAINNFKATLLSDSCTKEALAWATLLQAAVYRAQNVAELGRIESRFKLLSHKEGQYV